MATITSLATGNWNSTSTWVGSVVPGSGDTVNIANRHVVTVNAASLAANVLNVQSGGTVDLDYDFSVRTSIRMYPTGALTHNGSASSPRKIAPVGSTRPYVQFDAGTGGRWQSRYLELQGFRWTIGNDSYLASFNTENANSPIINQVTPPYREQNISNLFCEGRAYSRVDRRGGYAAVVYVSGKIPWNSYLYDVINAMMDEGHVVGLASQYVQLDSAYIENFKCSPKGGELKTPFAMTLVEAR